MCSEAELSSAAPRKKFISCKQIKPCHPITLLEDGACIQEASAVSLGTRASIWYDFKD